MYDMRTRGSGDSITLGQHKFSEVPHVGVQRSIFDRPSSVTTTFSGGDLVPIYSEEALPGDTFTLRMRSFVRMATQQVPIFDNIYMDVFFFAVPYRLVWDNWQKFNGEQKNPGDSTTFLCPQMTQTPTVESLSDYLGLPINTAADITFDSFWHRAYNLIWNEWFRDENLQDSVVVDLDDGPDDPADYVVLKRGKRHDYFSSALPFTQKGGVVNLPLGTMAPLQDAPVFTDGTTNATLRAVGGTNVNLSAALLGGIDLEFTGAASADLTAATAATINDLRNAFQVQRFAEKDARGGTRYTEILLAHFGVESSDQRLQRPEFLGGGSTVLNIHPVASTTQFAGNEIGTLRSFATGSLDGIGFTKSFTEHCLILGLANIRADLRYQQGIPRRFLRQEREDFFWPSFAHLGEQAIESREIFADGSAADDDVFGFQERYAEYRYKQSLVTGKMRSAAATPLDFWHMALDFGSRPLLNDVFIEDNPPIARAIAVPSEPEFLGDFYFDEKTARPMPTYSVPGMVDHF